jgi:hypothetical protein
VKNKINPKKNLSKEQYKTNCFFRFYFIIAIFARNKKTRILLNFIYNLIFFPKKSLLRKMLDFLTINYLELVKVHYKYKKQELF